MPERAIQGDASYAPPYARPCELVPVIGRLASTTFGKSVHAPRRSDVSVFEQTDPTQVAIVN